MFSFSQASCKKKIERLFHHSSDVDVGKHEQRNTVIDKIDQENKCIKKPQKVSRRNGVKLTICFTNESLKDREKSKNSSQKTQGNKFAI